MSKESGLTDTTGGPRLRSAARAPEDRVRAGVGLFRTEKGVQVLIWFKQRISPLTAAKPVAGIEKLCQIRVPLG